MAVKVINFNVLIVIDFLGAILIANIINFFATLISVSAIILHLPELLLVGRIIGAMGSGLAMNSIILFIQVKNLLFIT